MNIKFCIQDLLMNREYKTDDKFIYHQYKNDENLSKRIAIYKYNSNKYKWFNWVFDKFQIKENIKILELGCGNGLLWSENINKLPDNIEITLTDISMGMLEEAKNKINNKNFSFKVIDAESIPYNDKYFDIIIANHMLYHVKDINNTLFEIRRTLKDNGLFFASTFGKKNMKELNTWINKFSLNVDYNPKKLSINFGKENGKSILNKYFKKVKFIEYFDELKIPETKPIIDYLESIEKTDKNKTDYSKLIDCLNKIIQKRKTIKIRKKMGIFVCGNFNTVF